METEQVFINEIFEAIEDGKLELSSWENDFVNSIDEQIADRKTLSKKQRESIDRIHYKIRAW